MYTFCNYCCFPFESEHLSRISENEFNVNFKVREAFKVEIDLSKFYIICKSCEEKVEASYEFYHQILKSQQTQSSFVKTEPIDVVVKNEFEDYDSNQQQGSGYFVENFVDYRTGNESYEDRKDFHFHSDSLTGDMFNITHRIPNVKATPALKVKQKEFKAPDPPEFPFPALPHEKPTKPNTIRFRKGMPGYKSHASKGLIRPKAAAYLMSDVFDEEIENQKFYDVPEMLENLESNSRIWSHYKWNCTECEAEFENVIDLQVHLQDWHNRLPYRGICLECEKKSTNFAGFLNHAIEEHHPNLKFCCVVCSQHHQNFIDLYHHHQEEHPTKKIFFCLYCGMHFRSGCYVRDHAITKHNRIDKKLEAMEKFQCDLCEFQTLIKNKMSIHITKHKEKTLQCDKCSLLFRFAVELKHHQKEIHPEEGSEVVCTECGKKFSSMRRFQKHHRFVHLDVRNHLCGLCDKRFRTNYALQKHQITHDKNAEPSLQCPYCEKKYKYNGGLKYHIRTHFGEKPYICPIPGCEYRAIDFANANKHIKFVHKSDEKPIKVPSTPMNALKTEAMT